MREKQLLAAGWRVGSSRGHRAFIRDSSDERQYVIEHGGYGTDWHNYPKQRPGCFLHLYEISPNPYHLREELMVHRTVRLRITNLRILTCLHSIKSLKAALLILRDCRVFVGPDSVKMPVYQWALATDLAPLSLQSFECGIGMLSTRMAQITTGPPRTIAPHFEP
jgi:hypothetical protein